MSLEKRRIQQFQKKIFKWWKDNKRDFPWRKTTNPYHILVSEVMLQQTQAGTRTIKKYLAFIKKYPTLESLAKASKAEVLKLWSGLGYNRRAIWLQEAANQLVEMESFPKIPEELQKLKGIGPYTSRAILIFAFNEDLPTVDTNIRRILIAEGFAEESTAKKELFEIAEQLLPRGRSRDWHNALMDYGSIVLTAAKTGIKPTSRQTRFKGSSRDFRGRILRFLINHSESDQETISKECKIPKKKITQILESLLSDELIQKQGKTYSLPK
ncbi:MAG: Fe-S cluster assembly protein HesB [Candidatus Heimdallarchaeota archaeon]|nr:Fe-S cluster assembly protein HesB [Candidatus Heimdallarchaeota archaeon]